MQHAHDLKALPTPVSILTGFLGSGKTTMLAKFLRHPGMSNTIVIMNEFGEIGLDHELLQVPEDEVILLSNGCLCCAVLGDLITTILKLFDRRQRGELPPFERIVIETSGLADPAPILQTLISEPEVSDLIRLDKIVVVVDAVNAKSQLGHHFESVKQIAVADLVILSKSDLASPAEIEATLMEIAKVNRAAETHRVVLGNVGPEALFNAGPIQGKEDTATIDWLDRAERQNCHHHDCHDHHSHEGHHHSHEDHADQSHSHTTQVQSHSFSREGEIHPAALQLWLDQLATFRGPHLLRVKGILNVENRPIVVHAVQHLFHPAEEMKSWPTAERRSRIVVITHGISRDAIEATLPLLSFRPQAGPRTSAIDPDMFHQFSAAMRGISVR